MQVGAVIRKGIQDWQIVQQVNGFAIMELEGCYFTNSETPNKKEQKEIYLRVVDEDTSDVIISWKKAEQFGENEWKCTIKNVPAGGLYRLESCLKDIEEPAFERAMRGDIVNHIGVGDIYVIAGQSNSAGYGRDPVYDPPEMGVHIFKNSDKWDLASHPLNDSTDTKHDINREPFNAGHSPYLCLAKYLKRKLGYPIGLVQAALGGSALERWNPDEIGDLYDSMIERVHEQCAMVKGILWYQGCSDVSHMEQCKSYLSRFLNMVEHVRKDLGNPKLPVFTFQLARCTADSWQTNGIDERWSMIREAQRAATAEHDIYVIPTLDSVLSDSIHISSSSNMVLGERMAKLILHTIYHKTLCAYAPDIERAVICNRKTIRLDFRNVYDRLDTYGVTPDELSFCVKDKRGDNKICAYEVTNRKSICLKVEREIEEECVVSNAFGVNPKGTVPVDIANHYPILAFYEVKVNIMSDCKKYIEY